MCIIIFLLRQENWTFTMNWTPLIYDEIQIRRIIVSNKLFAVQKAVDRITPSLYACSLLPRSNDDVAMTDDFHWGHRTYNIDDTTMLRSLISISKSVWISPMVMQIFSMKNNHKFKIHRTTVVECGKNLLNFDWQNGFFFFIQMAYHRHQGVKIWPEWRNLLFPRQDDHPANAL